MAKVEIKNLQSAIEDILRSYGDEVYIGTEESLDEAAKVLINNLKDNTPKGETKRLSKGWKTTGKSYKLKRFIYNNKEVQGKKGKALVPLINIIEYSTTKGKPFVKNTFNESINEMANAVVNKLKNI